MWQVWGGSTKWRGILPESGMLVGGGSAWDLHMSGEHLSEVGGLGAWGPWGTEWARALAGQGDLHR